MASGRAARSTVRARSHHMPQTIVPPVVHIRSASSADFRAIFGQVAIRSNRI
ncbi:hypothetical protein M404DRAFT_1008891 [Pisolithus tinctorius Marx 270]|uniref:Uncharacterized protein n=1 Tax=Pisolithus tinctorius Marx 270 TaxID=870435 RepID=A0A0C3J721_PISTI|nr:hypothetical protein M404DRAFT_1008891 [Pisolithus tinctorius Marx 270]